MSCSSWFQLASTNYGKIVEAKHNEHCKIISGMAIKPKTEPNFNVNAMKSANSMELISKVFNGVAKGLDAEKMQYKDLNAQLTVVSKAWRLKSSSLGTHNTFEITWIDKR